ncbi:MAG: NTP transferase domain-containing protein [Gulosibacter sp.]|uniref:NTP transferase domain-containing protein n=1 Tax=Gulosibacter sp. TaxID=2817531 RepID=UPI003F912DE5
MTGQGSSRPAWTAIVPIRDFSTAKSRLRASLPSAAVDDLARWLAQRTIGELLACRAIDEVLVVSDAEMRGHFAEESVDCLVQRPGGGLNAAIREGMAAVWHGRPDARLLVTHADLPFVTSRDYARLAGKLHAIGEDTMVPDRAGTGTTMLALHPSSRRMPSFGEGSAARHEEQGFRRIELPRESGLRIDLDTIEDYREFANAVLSR